MTNPQEFTARLEDKQILNDKYCHFRFELLKPSRLEFQSGQYVSVVVDEHGTRRSYSICSRPDIGHGFELLLDMTPKGVGTQFFQNLRFGQEISLLAPMGQFIISDNDDQAIVFVATGSGIAPFRSMIFDLLQVRQDQRPITLYWGLRYVKDLFWENEFEELVENFKNFSFYPTISRPVPEWNLSTGRVTSLLEIHQFKEKTGFYLCGSTPMIEDCTKLLEAKGVEEKRIYYEKFF